MDDFYSGDNKNRSNRLVNDDDDFFAEKASPISMDFYSSQPVEEPKQTSKQGSNPFDSNVSFSEEEQSKANDFFNEDRIPGQEVEVKTIQRVPGDDKYPWQVGYWMSMFDVDTREVFVRIVHSLIPFRRAFIDSLKAKPDLWAPFWIVTTLFFCMAWTGNFAAYLNAVIAGTDAYYIPRVEKLPWGALLLYGYWLFIPLIFWGIFRWKEIPIRLIVCYGIFGYSLFCYIPISIISILALGPIQWLAWLLIMLACVWSTLTLGLSFFFLIHDERFKPGYVMILVMMALSVGLGLSFKLYFFDLSTPIGAAPIIPIIPGNRTNLN